MKISEVNDSVDKDQRVILQKITTRRMKIAALQAEIDALEKNLLMVASETAAWWDGVADDSDNLVVVPPCSEMNIPLPTVTPEKIVINSRGMFSSTRGFTPGGFGIDS